MSSHGLKLAVPPEMQQNPCLELNNGNAMWAAKYLAALSFLHFVLFCAPEYCSILATMDVPSHEKIAGSKVHV
ncbi:hypothetical protein V6N12_048976 [Hibiscus sabdariffa]|uniref:Uncharacterized protein n=1 Tax=Hibiscus sabdariffa TaxID=183260 RepID=A0ABR2EJ81_9ROSI